jgi:serine/threonine-protein kinase
MPPALGNLQDLRDSVDEEELASLLVGAADALAIAHRGRHIHRDLTPPNLLALPGAAGRRWVVADWGLVTRPYRSGSIPLTGAGIALGTEGFAAPEVLADGRSATSASDVYSLGQIAAWYLTGTVPLAGVRVLPEGRQIHWRSFVRACTEPDPGRRIGLEAFRAMLDEVFTLVPEPAAARAHALVRGVLLGEQVAVSELFRLAADHPDDADVYLDELARLPPGILRDWARLDPARAAEAACQMCEHLTWEESWQDRDAAYARTPLSFAHEILMQLAADGAGGPAEDVAHGIFWADLKWKQPAQRTRVREWLAGLDGEVATVIARVITRNPPFADYYHPVRARHPDLARALDGQPTGPLR